MDVDLLSSLELANIGYMVESLLHLLPVLCLVFCDALISVNDLDVDVGNGVLDRPLEILQLFVVGLAVLLLGVEHVL